MEKQNASLTFDDWLRARAAGIVQPIARWLSEWKLHPNTVTIIGFALTAGAAAIIERRDPRRIVRAMEVIELTGEPFGASKPPIDAPPRWGTRILGLGTEAEWLNERIDRRSRMMFDQGLLGEVEELIGQGLRDGVTASRAIGYAQVLAHRDGEYDLDEAVERTITGTRRYVRRQKSWFNRDPRVTWLDAAGTGAGGVREQALSALSSLT